MKKKRIIIPVFLFVAFSLVTCIDPFNPQIDNYQDLLVVDALVTDENSSYFVKLSRTTETPRKTPVAVTGAQVSVTDNLGNAGVFTEILAGVYKSDSTAFTGVQDKTYTLRIRTAQGQEYESDPSTLYGGRDIDTVTYASDRITRDDGEVVEGLRIYADSKGPADSRYFRWKYEEWWKFSIPYPKRFVYITQNNIYEIPAVNVTCWKTNKSDDINIQSREPGTGGDFIKKPVLFIPSEESNRLLLQYCIEISQLSLSENEYEFWDQMRQINESGGDIFDKQPFPVITNIRCTSDPKEKVLGYFQVSSISRKRIYITRNDVRNLNIKLYRYPCELMFVSPADFPHAVPPMTFNSVYTYYSSLNLTFIGPQTDEMTSALKALIFVDNYCADCTMTGSLRKPDFWIDLE